MDTHHNAALTPIGRARLVALVVEQGWSQRGVGRATVSRVLQRLGLNRLGALEPVAPPRRYEHEQPGDLLHLDIKKLGRFQRPGHRVTGQRTQHARGAGWEFVHVAIDDRSRVAYTDIRPDEGSASAVAHRRAAVDYYARLGVRVRRLLTDNGACYRSRAFATATIAAHREHSCSRRCSPTSRTARSRASGENRFTGLMTRSSQLLGSPEIPGRFIETMNEAGALAEAIAALLK